MKKYLIICLCISYIGLCNTNVPLQYIKHFYYVDYNKSNDKINNQFNCDAISEMGFKRLIKSNNKLYFPFRTSTNKIIAHIFTIDSNKKIYETPIITFTGKSRFINEWDIYSNTFCNLINHDNGGFNYSIYLSKVNINSPYKNQLLLPFPLFCTIENIILNGINNPFYYSFLLLDNKNVLLAIYNKRILSIFNYNKQWKPNSTNWSHVASYYTSIETPFSVFSIKNKIYLIDKSGAIYYINKKGKSLKQIAKVNFRDHNDLNDSYFIVDKDKGKVYFFQPINYIPDTTCVSDIQFLDKSNSVYKLYKSMCNKTKLFSNQSISNEFTEKKLKKYDIQIVP